MTGDTTNIPRREEYHVTVEDIDPIDWYNFCHEQGVKPLFIELNTMGLQLMCAMDVDPDEMINLLGTEHPNAKVVRVKHEVNMMNEDERPKYFEAHIKIDGPMIHTMPMASRDLYRATRWYLTKRSPNPFDAKSWFESVVRRMEPRGNQKVVGYEYEVCVADSNPSIDAGWER